MREIKFRAWDKVQQLFLREVVVKGNGEIRVCPDPKDTYYYMSISNRFIIEQYTGLKDSTDKEIYEGDILNSKDYPFQNEGVQGYYGVVEWFKEDLCWTVGVVCVNKKLRGSATGCQLTEHDWEIIGNIHENPELLKGGE